MGVGKEGVFLVRRSEEDELFDRLTKSWCPTAKFIVQIDIPIHKEIARRLIK
jgi:hypothetical protein